MARHSSSRRSKATRFVSNLMLNLAAAGGLLCIVLVALALALNMTLIMFKTGSMSPTIPAGSVALVQETPASSIEIGDVVTVDRAGKLPITHRVTSIEPATSGESRTFTMRGDANPVDDVDSYTATSVRAVRGHLPGLATVIVWLSHPLALGAITLAAAGLVTWAFWPRTDDAEETKHKEDADEARGDRQSSSKPAHRTSKVTLTVAFLAAVAATSLTATEQAHAVETETQINSTVLRLTSIGDTELMSNLNPGVPVNWQVGVSADAPNPGVVSISLSASGNTATAQKLTVGIDSCAVRWVSETCTTGQQTLVQTQLLADALLPQSADGTRLVTTMPSAEQRWVLVTVTLAEAVEPGFSETLHVHASGFGDEVSTTGETQTLPATGSSMFGPVLLALTAVITGILVAWHSTFWRRRRQ